MNGIYLFLQRMKQYIQNNRTVFILFIMGGIVNTVMVLYCYGNLLPVVSSRNDQALRYRSYQAVPLSAVTQQDLEHLQESDLVQGFAVTDGSGIYASWGEFPMKSAGGSVHFDNGRQMIAPVGADWQIGDIITYRQEEFRLIGFSTWGQRSFIPWEAFQELTDLEQITRIEVVAKQRQNPYRDEMKLLLQELFPDNSSEVYGVADNFSYVNKALSQQYFSLILCSAFLAVIAHLLVLNELLDSGRRENAISRLLGVGKGGLASMVLAEATVFCAAANGLGILVHILLYRPLFTELNISENIQYSLGDYCLVYLLMLLLSLVAVIPILWKASGVSPADAGRKAF